jgi:hypothetical protein
MFNKTYLFNLHDSNKAVHNPRESRLEWRDAQLLQMVADLRLIHLEQVFEQLA